MEMSRLRHAAPIIRRLRSPSVKGKGLNSIPIRFALMVAVFSAIGVFLQYRFFYADKYPVLSPGMAAAMALMVAVPSIITFLAASKLARAVRSLDRSTNAIAAGDFDSPVEVSCDCEVGGLADSFRTMVRRFNSNILRMNVLAYVDQVTGLPNRTVLTHALHTYVRRCSARECRGALFFMDMDNFKHVNDTLGHEAGDELLRQASDRIIEQGLGLRREDLDTCTRSFGELNDSCPRGVVFSRFGGDEFVAFFPIDQDYSVLEQRVLNILKALEQPFVIYGQDLCIGASIGIARFAVDTRDADQLLKYADIAMYSAKEAGKNQYRFFDALLAQTVYERAQLESDLRKAMDAGGEISVHFQPKVDARTLELHGVEALARWRHPERGMIPPDKFIKVAEQSGMMPALGFHILRLAIEQAVAWRDAGNPVQVAVNVSAVQFREATFVSEVFGLLEKYRLDPSLLGIEITESMVMSDLDGWRVRMGQLQNAGVAVAIDDFGAGYSNLSQLAHLPYEILKIDKSLISEIRSNPRSDAVLVAIVDVAHALGHKVVVEGVEHPHQQAFLTEIGCDQLQGYLLGRPMPAQDLEKWRREHAAKNHHSERKEAS